MKPEALEAAILRSKSEDKVILISGFKIFGTISSEWLNKNFGTDFLF